MIRTTLTKLSKTLAIQNGIPPTFQPIFKSSNASKFSPLVASTSSQSSSPRYQSSTSSSTSTYSGHEECTINTTIENNLLNTSASVRRTFSPNSNAQALLVCGGKELAAHASFDPEYNRAKGYIQNHPVGPAVLSPILISGLVGALTESTFPQSFFVKGDIKQVIPLIVGVEVEANIQVVSVRSGENGDTISGRENGYELVLDTQVKRVSDGSIISVGSQTIWLPDYGHM